MSAKCNEKCLDGTPCERPAGWGTDNSAGPCVEHVEGGMRPRKLTHELQERIASDLEAGMPAKYAAPSNGISKETYYRWWRLGENEEEGVLSDFSDRVSRAEALGKASLITDAIRIARENDDARTLLKAYAAIENGEKAHEDDDNVIPLVVPDNAMPDEGGD